MHVVLIDPWPNQPHMRALCELPRLRKLLQAAGWQVSIAALSDKIEALAPDLVLALDALTPKLTGHPTLAILSGPQWLLDHDAERRAAMLSMDGYLPLDEAAARNLKTLCRAHHKPLVMPRPAALSALPLSIEEVMPRLKREQGHERPTGETPEIEVILQARGAGADDLTRSLASIAAQSWPALSLTVLADAGTQDRLQEALSGIAPHVTQLHVLEDGLFTALAANRAGYQAGMMAGDAWHPNHLASLVRCLARDEAAPFAFSGLVGWQSKPPPYACATRFAPQPSRETRWLQALRGFDLAQIKGQDGMIGRSCWLARAVAVRSLTLPEAPLGALEQEALYRLLAVQGQPAFSALATVEQPLSPAAEQPAPNADKSRMVMEAHLAIHARKHHKIKPRSAKSRRAATLAAADAASLALLVKSPRRAFALLRARLQRLRQAHRQGGLPAIRQLLRDNGPL